MMRFQGGQLLILDGEGMGKGWGRVMEQGAKTEAVELCLGGKRQPPGDSMINSTRYW